MSTNTLCVTLKSPKMSNDDDKQSNYSKRHKKRYDFLIDFSPICISLNVKFSIPT